MVRDSGSDHAGGAVALAQSLQVGMDNVLFSLMNHWSLKIMRSVRANVSSCHSR